ncbi:MAG TPA: class I SAM-dependent methyltransferase [Haliangiales bacterium]|nr:class I SAM-dependent methyltransferase [Haliangiales bacterium]
MSEAPLDLDRGTEDHYADPVLYDFEYRRRRADVNHYRLLAGTLAGEGPILELGCGTGRLSVPLARDGHRVVGIDLAPGMLQRAAAKAAQRPRAAARLLLARADMRRLPFRRRFPFVVSPFNAFQHLYTRADVLACLAEVRAHLDPSGRLAFDVLQPDLRWLQRDPNKRWARTVFAHPETGERLEYTTNHTYDPASQIAHIRIYYRSLETDRTRVVHLAHRQFFPEEICTLLWAGGFQVERRWGGFTGEPFDGTSESQVFLCRPVEK